MRLIIVRHGETVQNRDSIMQGQIGGTLTRKGITQAKKLAKRLSKERFDAVYCSDLKRTRDTLKEIMKYHPKTKVHYAKEIRERSFGIWEGRNHQLIDEHLNRKGIRFTDWHPKGGETREQKDKRVLRFYKKIKKSHLSDTVLWVTHGGPIATIIAHVNGLTDAQRSELHFDNTSVNIIEIDANGDHKAKLVNCVKHL